MAGPRYVLGWGAVLALSVGASAGTLVLVRQAIGDGNLVDPLSQSQVHTQYADALHPKPNATATPGSGSTSSGANAPTSTPGGHHSTTPSTGKGSGQSGGTGGTSGSSHSHTGGGGSSSTTHSTPPPPPPTTVTRLLTTSGGSVVAQCTSSSSGPARIYLVSWSPNQGYTVNGVQRGPGEEAEIEFESDASTVSVQYHCTSTGPAQQLDSGSGWGGGGDDGGSGGSGGGDS